MRFPLSVPALAAGALLAAVSLTPPALANSGQAKADGAFEDNKWAADAMSSSVDLICPERRDIFGRSLGKFLMRKDAFDLIWFPLSLDLREVWKSLDVEKASGERAGKAEKGNGTRHN